MDFTNFAEELRGFSCQDAAIDHIFYYFMVSDQFISTTDRGIVDYQWFTDMSFKNTLMQNNDYRNTAGDLKKPAYFCLTVDNYGRESDGILCCFPVKRNERKINLQSLFFIQLKELERVLDLAMPEGK